MSPGAQISIKMGTVSGVIASDYLQPRCKNKDMWNTFWPDLLIAVIGAALTVLVAWVTYRLQRRSNEKHALRFLVEEIHHRRALAPIARVGDVPSASELDDFSRANASILDIKDRIRLTREQSRPASSAQHALSDMTRACNRYLEITSHRPEKYLHELMSLRSSLSESIQRIAEGVRGVRALEPGGSAF